MALVSSRGKIDSRENVVAICDDARRRGERVCFSSGTFDILHSGHIFSLEQARSLADRLVVGINSDISVKLYKGDKRPIQSEENRAAVVAALGCVDHVFLFDEANTNRSIELLRPEVYAKGGQYSEQTLSSASLVKAYGGRVEILPHLYGESSSAVISRVLERYAPEEATFIPVAPYERRPAVFLDRDGTINEHVDYLHEPERLRIFPGALQAIKRMRDAGARIVVVTNQPGIGTGYFSKDDFFRVNKVLLKAASEAGLFFDRIFFCPHSVGDRCSCRKPGIGMVQRAEADLNIDLASSFVVGDMTSDIEMGRVAGVRTILVRTGRAGHDGLFPIAPDFIADNLTEAAEIVVEALRTAPLQERRGRDSDVSVPVSFG